MKNDGDVSPQLAQTCVQGPFRVPCNQLFCVPIFKWSTRLTIIRYEKHSTLIDHFSILYMVLKTKKGEWSRQFIDIQLLQNYVPKLYLNHSTAWKIFKRFLWDITSDLLLRICIAIKIPHCLSTPFYLH